MLGGVENERFSLLVALVVALRCQRKLDEIAERFRRLFPGVEKLSGASSHADAVARGSTEPKLSAKQKHEQTRRKWHRSFFNSIEYQFGGEGEEEWGKSLMGLSGLPYEPSCLDEVLRGGLGERRTLPGIDGPVASPPFVKDTVTNMRRLEALFGMHRNRFPKKLKRHRVGTEIVYDWRAVFEIMRALLAPRKRKKHGAPLRRWLEKPALRKRVLSGIAQRIKDVCAEREIAQAFQALKRKVIRLKNR